MNPEWGKFLMLVGGVLFVVGALVALNLMPWVGRLPGDIAVRKDNFSFYFPLTTCILISVILTVIIRLFRK